MILTNETQQAAIPTGSTTRRLSPRKYATVRLQTAESPLGLITPAVLSAAPHASAQEIPSLLNFFSEQEVIGLLERYKCSRSLIQFLAPEEREQFLLKISTIFNSPEKSPKFAALAAIFRHESTMGFENELIMENFPLDKITEILSSDNTIFEILRIMLKKPDNFRFQAGVILSKLPFLKLPSDLAEELKPFATNVDMSVNHEAKFWSLCSEAEPRMNEAKKTGLTVLVNENFLVKGVGLMSALCLENTVTADGSIFIAGNWYSPRDDKSRDSILRAVFDGQSTLILPNSQWSLMRPIATQNVLINPREFLQQTRYYAAHLPEKFPPYIQGKTRKDYYEFLKSNHVE